MAMMSGFSEPADSDLTYEEVVSILQEKLGHLCSVQTTEVKNKIDGSQDRTGMEKITADGDGSVDPADPDSDAAIVCQFLKEVLGEPEQRSSEMEKYDINCMEDLIIWKHGQTIRPEIMTSINRVRDFIDEYTSNNKDQLADFMNMDNRSKFHILINLNESFYLHKRTWDFISENLDNPHVITRILIVMVIKADEINVNRLCKGLLNNLDLFREYIC